MATGEGSNRRARWDQLSPEDAGGIVAARRDAREAETAKRSRTLHHAKWIAINLALIAFTGWLYAAFLIPRFIVGDTSATRVAPDSWIADRPSQSPADDLQERSTSGRVDVPVDRTSTAAFVDRGSTTVEQERRRLRREQKPLSQAELAEFDSLGRAIKRGDARCIGGRGYRYERSGDATTIVDTGMTCHVDAGSLPIRPHAPR